STGLSIPFTILSSANNAGIPYVYALPYLSPSPVPTETGAHNFTRIINSPYVISNLAYLQAVKWIISFIILVEKLKMFRSNISNPRDFHLLTVYALSITANIEFAICIPIAYTERFLSAVLFKLLFTCI
ncbi:hypothetical protein L9F63_019075, partial [Diploptera punctata]